ncbi:MAG: cell division protein FtsQ [Cyclobacteriaceae bacterium]|nr:cell division protein FtsQ [Cyclobacteriaceae bacterium]
MKWKVNIRKEVKVAAALVALSILIAFSEQRRDGLVCKNITIEIDNIRENHFMDEADVLKLVTVSAPSIIGSNLGSIDLRTIEKKLKQDKHIRDAELYGDLKGNLIVKVELRRPLARIVQSDAPDAYIATDGAVMPVSDKYTARVMLISGAYTKQLLEWENLNQKEEGKKLLALIAFIQDNKFWKAQVAQLDISSHGKITMLPQVTGQLVEFGKADDFENKFRKLMIFYKEILPTRGWTRYNRINLEYEGQIIAE